MKAVVDRIVQYANRYQLTNIETGEVLGTFDFEEVTGAVQQVGTEIDKELFDSIANDLAARVKLTGGELAETIVTFPDISGTAANVASGDTSATLWGKVKNWFSRLKALAFKNKVGAGDFEAGAIKNADVAADAAIAQGKVNGLMTDYVASISVSGRTVTYKNKNGANMGSIDTQDTTYEPASQSSNGLMSSTDKKKLDGIESGAQKNTVLGVKGGSESAYRTGNVNITKANIGLGNVDNTSDEDKPVSAATQKALNGKANTSGSYPNLTVGNAEKLGNKAASEYALGTDIPDVSNFAEKTGTYSGMTVGNATNADNATNATKAKQDANGNVISDTYAEQTGKYPNLKSGGNTVVDTRSVNSPPSYYADQETCYEFKTTDILGLTDYMPNAEYILLTTKKGWGGDYIAYQEAVSAGYSQNDIRDSIKCYRYGAGETWGEWKVIFAVDPTKLAPSTANGWTQTTATGTLPSAGVYMVVPGGMTYGIGVMFYDEKDFSSTVIGNPGGSYVLYYLTSGDTRWVLVGSDGGAPINLSDVYYKRIA